MCPSPAFAGLTFGGKASVRLQDWITGIPTKDNVDWQYRLNLRAAADLGEGYYFKALFTAMSYYDILRYNNFLQLSRRYRNGIGLIVLVKITIESLALIVSEK